MVVYYEKVLVENFEVGNLLVSLMAPMIEKGFLVFFVTLISRISMRKILGRLRSKIHKIRRRFRKLLARTAVQPINQADDDVNETSLRLNLGNKIINCNLTSLF